MVVLHRVSAAGSGPVDSVRTQSSGAFSLTYRKQGDGIYLISVQRFGVAYFSLPLGVGADAPSDPVDIPVFDTSSVAPAIAVRGRHLIVSRPDGQGQRAVVEVFDLANDTSVTFVSAGASAPVFRAHLPAAAIKPRVGEGTFSAEAVSFEQGEARLFAPLPPGVKQLVLSYELPSSAFPLAVPVEFAGSLVEVLVEEASGRVDGARLQSQPPVTVSGRRFMRSLAQNVEANSVITVALPPVAIEQAAPNTWVLLAILGVVGLGLWWWVRRPRRATLSAPAQPSAAPSVPDGTALAERVATLDTLLENEGLPSDLRSAYQSERAHVMQRLRTLLANRE